MQESGPKRGKICAVAQMLGDDYATGRRQHATEFAEERVTRCFRTEFVRR